MKDNLEALAGGLVILCLVSFAFGIGVLLWRMLQTLDWPWAFIVGGGCGFVVLCVIAALTK